MAKRLEELAKAPDFELVDTRGQKIRLAGFRGRQPVVLVMNRGFI
jgi:peroxiredoxin